MNSRNKYSNPFTATLTGILNLFKNERPIGVLNDTDRIDGKVCLVTGANSGLGFAIAKQLASRGGRIIMACRSGIPEAGEKIRRLTGSKVEMIRVDLSEPGSIRAFLQEIRSRSIRFDIAVFNAAVVPKGSRKNSVGLDEMFMVNYFSKFILIRELLANDLFNTNGSVPRIIYVSSESHRSSVDIAFDKLGQYQEYTMSKVISLYGYYKLHLNTLAAELSRRLNANNQSGYSIHSVCPGAVNTNIAREAPRLFKPLLKVVFKLFFQKPDKAAYPIIYLACSGRVEGTTGYYLHMMTMKEADKRAVSSENGSKLWHASEKLLTSIDNANDQSKASSV